MSTIENAVVNSTLCYMTSARKTYSEHSIITTCLSFYSTDKIYEAKELLYRCIGETAPKRRGDNKTKSDLNDMMETLKKIDSVEISVPDFLSDSHANMPPSSGFEILSEHLLDIITEVSSIKEKIENLGAESVKN